MIEDYLGYNEFTGELFWLKSTAHRVKVGDRAGYYGRYVTVSLLGKRYNGHDLCWFLHHREFPKGQLDHKDQDTHNNRIGNLRDVTPKINAKNKPKRRDNTSGVTGISKDKASGKWVVRIKNKEGKYENRGRYTSFDEAKRVRDQATYELGYHQNHGRELSRLPYRRI